MSGFTEEVLISVVGGAISFGAHVVYKAGELMVKGAAGLIIVTGKGAKALASAIAEQHRAHQEIVEQKKIERDKKREEERLEALGNKKKIAADRIKSIISDSNESADKLSQLIKTARNEMQGVRSMFVEIGGKKIFDCGKALIRLEEIAKKIDKTQTRLESDNTVADLQRTGESIQNAEQSEQVRNYEKTLHGNGELVAELQIETASARMECEALKKCATALTELQNELSDLSLEVNVLGATYLERINNLITATDVTDYDSIMQAYQSTSELISQLKNVAETAKNVRLAAFLNSRFAVIQDRLNAIRGEAVEKIENSFKSEYDGLLAKAEEYYAVLTDGRLDYKRNIIEEKLRIVRLNVRAQNDIVAVRKTVKYLQAEVDCYEDICLEYEKYFAVKSECDELAIALGYEPEPDFLSIDKEETENEIDRLAQLKQTYAAELAVNRRSMLIARSSVDFASEEYEFLGEFELGDEDGNVQLLYARKGEVGAIHVVQADLNGYVYTFTTGVSIIKGGASLTTVGSTAVKKACSKMREAHLKNIKEFNEIAGLEGQIPVITDIASEDPAASDYPCIVFDESVNSELLKEYLKAVNGYLYMENGELKLKEIEESAQETRQVIKGTGTGRQTGAKNSGTKGGYLAVDPNKK